MSNTHFQSPICILGMHRSGTSCLTGSLEQYGLYLGNVINSAPHNLKGNKENNATWKINDEVLRQSGGSWDNPPRTLIWNRSLEVQRDQYIQSYQSERVWGFKDPRCVLTLDFWLKSIPDLRFAGTFRHPQAVADSLNKRNGFTAKQSFMLWNQYNQKLIRYFDRLQFPVVDFNWSPDFYQHSIHSLSKFLHLDRTDSSARSDFYESSLIHQNIDSHSDSSIPDYCLETYEQLIKISEETKLMLKPYG